MDKNRVYVLNWYGPFENLDQVKEWEEKEGDDTYLYIFRGMKKNAKKKITFYCGQAFLQSAGKRMKNKNHHIEEVYERPDQLNIWVAKFVNIKPKKTDVNVVEHLFIAFMKQYLIGKNEEVANRTAFRAPRCQLYVINEWWNKNSEEIGTYRRGSLFSRIPDVIACYTNGALYTSSKLSYRTTLK